MSATLLLSAIEKSFETVEKPLFDRIVTKTYIKKVICINKLPIDYDYSLVGVLNSIVFTTSPVSKIYTNSYSMSTEVPINSDQFKRFMSASEEFMAEVSPTQSNLRADESFLSNA